MPFFGASVPVFKLAPVLSLALRPGDLDRSLAEPLSRHVGRKIRCGIGFDDGALESYVHGFAALAVQPAGLDIELYLLTYPVEILDRVSELLLP